MPDYKSQVKEDTRHPFSFAVQDELRQRRKKKKESKNG